MVVVVIVVIVIPGGTGKDGSSIVRSHAGKMVHDDENNNKNRNTNTKNHPFTLFLLLVERVERRKHPTSYLFVQV